MKKIWIFITFIFISISALSASANPIEGQVESVNFKKNTLKLESKKYSFDRHLKVLLISADSDYLPVSKLKNGMYVKLNYIVSKANKRKVKEMTLLIH